MGNSIFSDEYGRLLRMLKAARKKAHITQDELARCLGQTQSFVSKCERGERRLDVVELLRFCKCIKANPSQILGSITPPNPPKRGKNNSKRF